MYQPNLFEKYTKIMSALSDEKRLKILWLLYSVDAKINASEIIYVLDENQYNVSRHIKVLKQAGLVYEKKEGKWTYYYYLPSSDEFDNLIRKAVLTIPQKLMDVEITRCKEKLSQREDCPPKTSQQK